MDELAQLKEQVQRLQQQVEHLLSLRELDADFIAKACGKAFEKGLPELMGLRNGC